MKVIAKASEEISSIGQLPRLYDAKRASITFVLDAANPDVKILGPLGIANVSPCGPRILATRGQVLASSIAQKALSSSVSIIFLRGQNVRSGPGIASN